MFPKYYNVANNLEGDVNVKRFFSFMLVFMLCLQAFNIGTARASEFEQAVTVTSEARALENGDRGEDVKIFQERLRELLYLDAKATGNYLNQTEKAVKAVQEAYGLEQTGVADIGLLEIIYGEDVYRPLKKDSKGRDVRALQERLSEFGFYYGNVTGTYLDATGKAVEIFQSLNGFPVTGIADIATQEKLYGNDFVLPTPDPHATPSPTEAPTTPPDTAYPGKIKYGSQSNAVTTLQEQLAYLGYFLRKPTGGFYKQTQSAVQDFQKQNGLANNGVVEEDTWEALFSDGAVLPHQTAKPTPEPTPIPYFIEVDVNNQLVKVFRRDKNNEFTDLHKVFISSTGTSSFPSDVGVWTLNGRHARWAHFPTWGGGYAQYWTRINRGIAFHSFLYTPDRKQVKMNSVKALGRPASHGCIRMTLFDAKWIYDNIHEGVEVWIHEDGLIDPELKYSSLPGAFDTRLGYHAPTPVPTQQPVYDMTRQPAGVIRELKIGDTGEDVFWLQSRLKELGFYPGSVTGHYREGTRDAVKGYQKANSLRGGGIATPDTLQLLYSQTAQAAAVLVTSVPEPTDSPVPISEFVVEPDVLD